MIHEILIALITVFALAITIVSAFSYRKTGNKKVLIVTIAFAVFFVKGTLLTWTILQGDADLQMLLMYTALLDFIILALLFVSIILRK
jgi:hypothetical protein